MMDEYLWEIQNESELAEWNISKEEIETYFFPVSSNDEEYIPFL